MADEPELHDLSGVEVFRAGTWNGDKYTTGDLDDMVAAFDAVGFRPPVKLGHKENSGDPAYGWVKAIKRVGDKLIADFMDLPVQVFNAIKSRAFDTVSSEIFWNLKRGSENFRRVLKGVALLGAEIPAVAGLKPLRESFAVSDSIHFYNLIDEDIMDKTPDELLAEENAALKARIELLEKAGDHSAEIKALKDDLTARDVRIAKIEEDRRQERIASKVKGLRVPAYRDFMAALYQAVAGDVKTYAFGKEQATPEAVLDAMLAKINHDTERLFKELAPAGDLSRDDTQSDEDPKKEVDRRVLKYMADNKTDDYKLALKAVLNADAELKQAYAES